MSLVVTNLLIVWPTLLPRCEVVGSDVLSGYYFVDCLAYMTPQM